MNSILESLCEAYCHLPDDYYQRKDVIEQYYKVEKMNKDLTKTLNKEQILLLEKLLNEQSWYESMESSELFCQGIKVGMRLYEELKE